ITRKCCIACDVRFMMFLFFFSSRRRHTRSYGDWSSDVCSSDLDAGYDVVMVNCNPETVSTDYDTSDRLYVEPLTFEDVMEIVDAEQPIGVIVQLGGQTPLKLARALEAAGVPILGTTPDAIDIAEDRGRFGTLLAELDLPHAPWGVATSFDEAKESASRLG